MPSIPRLLGFDIGGGGSGARKAQEGLANEQARLARQLFESTAPLRDTGLQQLTQFLQTGDAPGAIAPAFGALMRTGREGLESQFSNARDRLLSTTPSQGGQLNQQLGDLETSRAQSIGRLQSDIEAPLRNQLFQQAIGTGFGAPSQTLAGLSSAGAQFGNLAAQRQAEQAQMDQMAKQGLSTIGQGLGFGLAGK